ncbi:o-succinylbenzoate synthase [Robiginitalea sp. SC105]|uniref:o-succinylbenzoate synthase n=1 Tax=Robiginitalea sp. SC105 TaxID=2762332 RepID=UPI00163A2DF9|nr:o-succinylbenzoate synthase [Robiginitalea sp. SC105]MBC2840702.1 o-succinylbenzoate synthase [Robiginitalea sp. SC105]
MEASHIKYTLDFIRPGGTSRGVLTQKETHFLCLADGENWGIGECALFRGLSWDDRPGYQQQLDWACGNIHRGLEALREELCRWPSLVFGLEQAFRSLQGDSPMQLFDSGFTSGTPIPINGLIWMGDAGFMREQIRRKIAEGYRCLKLKIGSLDFETELALIRQVRQEFPEGELEIRVDANGAFTPGQAPERLHALAALGLHSIEQPIRQGQWEEMAALCRENILPIALDEELIGICDPEEKIQLLEAIRPQYIILKPSLIGGFAAGEEWIRLAGERNIGWWVTSALESNVGLNAIAQWTAGLETDMPQGLGTGSLFSNNFDSPLETDGGHLWYRADRDWNIPLLKSLCT